MRNSAAMSAIPVSAPAAPCDAASARRPAATAAHQLRARALHLRAVPFPQPRARDLEHRGDGRHAGMAHGDHALMARLGRPRRRPPHPYRAELLEDRAAVDVAAAVLGGHPDRPRADHPPAPLRASGADARPPHPARPGDALFGDVAGPVEPVCAPADVAAAGRLAARLHRAAFLAAAQPALPAACAGAVRARGRHPDAGAGGLRRRRPRRGCQGRGDGGERHRAERRQRRLFLRLGGLLRFRILLRRRLRRRAEGRAADLRSGAGRHGVLHRLGAARHRRGGARDPRAASRAQPPHPRQLHRRPLDRGARRPDLARAEPHGRHPARLDLRRQGALLDLPRQGRGRRGRFARAQSRRGDDAEADPRRARHPPRLPAPAAPRHHGDAHAAAARGAARHVPGRRRGIRASSGSWRSSSSTSAASRR